jgi:hypothetical protein
LLGLYCLCRARAVYAAHVLAVELLMPDLAPSRDWLVVQIPILPPLAKRAITVDDLPPFLPKRFVDPDWQGDAAIEQAGPCPRARRAVVAMIAGAKSMAVHVPQCENWLASLAPGATLRGEILIDDRPLSERLIEANLARPVD